jgi:transposase
VQAGPGSHLAGMHAPIFVRELSGQARARLEAALRAPSAFTVRRAQIVLASAAGRRPREIARDLRCAAQTVRNGIRAFDARGVGALEAGSSRPRSAAPVLGGAERERLRAILHQPPCAFGRARRSTWTLDLLARVAHQQGLSPRVLSGETIRQALLRLGVGWRRAKRWLTSPDPDYAQKTPPRPADRPGAGPAGLGARLRRRGLVLPPRAAGPARLDGGGRAASARLASPRPRPGMTSPTPTRRRWPATACGCPSASGCCCGSSRGDRSAP